MIKRFCIVLALALAALSLSAQDPAAMIRRDYSRMGANYHNYEPPAGPIAAAPEGFVPFYISHYGRHGSRYLTYKSSYKETIAALRKLEENGLLKARGRKLLSRLRAAWDLTEDRLGRLTSKGIQEHRGIASRMYDRFPEVFAADTKVEAVSSTSRRCKTSMVSFLGALTEKETSLDVNIDASKENMKYILNHGDESFHKEVKRYIDSLNHAVFDPEALLKPLVRDYDRAAALLEDPVAFERKLYDCVAISQCLPDEYDILWAVPYGEGVKMWSLKNKHQYLYHGNSTLYGARRLEASRPLAEDIVYKADKAISKGSPTASLRFGHDSALLALEAYIGVSGFDECLSPEQTDRWQNFRLMCMGSNLQLVFYRKGDDILVRVLQNERDASIPALGPGPFYSWNALRAHLLREKI